MTQRMRGLALVGTVALGLLTAGPARAGLVVSPGVLSFGQLQGGETALRQVLVVATGEETTVEAVELTGGGGHLWFHGGPCEGATLQPGEGCGIAVFFDAPDVDDDYQATLTARAGGGGVATGVVQASSYRAGELTPDSAEIDFGQVMRPGPLLPRTVSLRNRTDGPLVITSAATSGFRVSDDRCGEVVQAGSTCSVGVSLFRAGFGPISGNLVVRSSYPYEPTLGPWPPTGPSLSLSIPLRVTVTRRAVVPRPTPASPPPRVDFRGVRFDLQSLAASVGKRIRGGPLRRVRLPGFESPVAGRMRLVLQAILSGKRVRLVEAAADVVAQRPHRLEFTLPKRARKLLRRPRATHVRAVVAFDPTGATPAMSQARRFVIQPPAKKSRRR